MIVAVLNQKGGTGKTTLALHLAGQWARDGARVTLVDADPQASALDWAEQRAREGAPRLFAVLGLARSTLHQEAPDLARGAVRLTLGWTTTEVDIDILLGAWNKVVPSLLRGQSGIAA